MTMNGQYAFFGCNITDPSQLREIAAILLPVSRVSYPKFNHDTTACYDYILNYAKSQLWILATDPACGMLSFVNFQWWDIKSLSCI